MSFLAPLKSSTLRLILSVAAAMSLKIPIAAADMTLKYRVGSASVELTLQSDGSVGLNIQKDSLPGLRFPPHRRFQMAPNQSLSGRAPSSVAEQVVYQVPAPASGSYPTNEVDFDISQRILLQRQGLLLIQARSNLSSLSALKYLLVDIGATVARGEAVTYEFLLPAIAPESHRHFDGLALREMAPNPVTQKSIVTPPASALIRAMDLPSPDSPGTMQQVFLIPGDQTKLFSVNSKSDLLDVLSSRQSPPYLTPETYGWQIQLSPEQVIMASNHSVQPTVFVQGSLTSLLKARIEASQRLLAETALNPKSRKELVSVPSQFGLGSIDPELGLYQKVSQMRAELAEKFHIEKEALEKVKDLLQTKFEPLNLVSYEDNVKPIPPPNFQVRREEQFLLFMDLVRRGIFAAEATELIVLLGYSNGPFKALSQSAIREIQHILKRNTGIKTEPDFKNLSCQWAFTP